MLKEVQHIHHFRVALHQSSTHHLLAPLLPQILTILAKTRN